MAEKKKPVSSDINNENTQVTIGAVVFIFILVLLVIFLIRPTISGIMERHTMIEERESSIVSLNAKISSLEKAKINYDEIENKIVYLDEAIPNTASLTETLSILEKNASDVVLSGLPLAITRIVIDNPPDVEVEIDESSMSAQTTTRQVLPQKEDVEIRVTVRADYEAARYFIQNIKANRRNFQVERLTLTAPSSRQGRILDISITLNNFYYQE